MALTDAEVQSFFAQGFVKVEQGLPRDFVDDWVRRCWARLDIDPADPSTFKEPRTHLSSTESFDVKEVAPSLFNKMVDLVGGEVRAKLPMRWSDGFIANLGERADEPWQAAGPDCPGWHVDGDFFLHFLDSAEQGLLTVVLWTDVVHQGGPTYLATDSVPVIARYLADHPEGVEPNGFDFRARVRECKSFAEATGKAGDVYLIHPFVLHAVSQNVKRLARVITNPPLSLAEPMNFDRADGAYSPVEQAVLRGLGVSRLDFQPTSERQRRQPGKRSEGAMMATKP